LLRQQWLAGSVAVVVVVGGCTAAEAAAFTGEQAVASTAEWVLAESEVLRLAAAAKVLQLAAGFAARKLTSDALTVATTLPGAAVGLTVAIIATGLAEA
jgi:hypothetical protein